MIRHGLRVGLVATIASMGLIAGIGASGASGSTQGAPVTVSSGSCAWPVMANPTTLNVAYPDSDATYYGLILPGVTGETLTIDGQFPHARYMSFTAYDEETTPVDNLNDQEIVPTPGSTNPFLFGANRTASHRNYAVTVVFGPEPAHPAPNHLYTTDASGSLRSPAFIVIYRIYLPDAGLDALGGVSLPNVTVHLHGVSTTLPNCPSVSAPAASALNQSIADLVLPRLPLSTGATSPPVWHKASAGLVSFFSNPDNNYLTLLLGESLGNVVIIRGRMPTFPLTDQGQATMGGGQVRYWSMCSNEQLTTRYWGCIADYQMAIPPSRQYIVVVSTAAARPSNALQKCGINWLPWGPAPDSLLLMRNMLPSPSFTQSVQDARVGHEALDMGPYYPSVSYTTAAGVERLGCPG
jgi:hypothetical protein